MKILILKEILKRFFYLFVKYLYFEVKYIFLQNNQKCLTKIVLGFNVMCTFQELIS